MPVSITARSAPSNLAIAIGLLGSLLMWPVSERFRIDLVRCAGWPPWPERLGLCLLYLLGTGLLFGSWQKLLRRAQVGKLSSQKTWLAILLWHSAVLLSRPFLSDDPLFYVAIGRVLHAAQASLLRPLLDVLGPTDEVLRLMPEHWQRGTSAYQPGFHGLAWLVEAIPGLSVAGRIAAYQVISLGVVLSTCIVSSEIARRRGQPAAYGAALIGLCPLTLLEGTLSAHNDVWLMLLAALAAWLWLGRFRWTALLPLLAGLLVKLSALLALTTFGLTAIKPHLRIRPLTVMGLGALLLLLAVVTLRWLHLDGQIGSVVLGSPTLPWDHCTRSLECLPRSILRYGFDRPDLSYVVGVGFRIIGGLWLMRIAWRYQNPATAMAWGLLTYYLYLHGWAQSWYFLSVLPLSPFLSVRHGRVLEVLCGSACAYYALALFRNCLTEPWQVALCEIVECLITILPPTVVLLRKESLAYVRAST